MQNWIDIFSGNGPFLGVVDLFGSAGGLLEYRSAQLASRGIASLALAFFAYDDLPKKLEEFDISYFEEAVEFLLKHEKVIACNFLVPERLKFVEVYSYSY